MSGRENKGEGSRGLQAALVATTNVCVVINLAFSYSQYQERYPRARGHALPMNTARF